MIKLGVIGDPVGHSLSPVLHTLVLEQLGLAGEYRAYRVRHDELKSFLQAHRELTGFNVTIPHKERILHYLDEVTPQAQRIGAVNTVKNDHKRLVGYNTDSMGFVRSLRKRDFSPQRVILLGAGGASRAVAHALLQSGTATLLIYNRTVERAVKLTEELRRLYPDRNIFCESDPQALCGALGQTDLVVNATSVGMKDDALPISLPESLPDRLLVYDLIYNPLKTRLLTEAERRGAQTMNGLDMLIYQAIESLKIWLEDPALERKIAYESLESFLKKEHLWAICAT